MQCRFASQTCEALSVLAGVFTAYSQGKMDTMMRMIQSQIENELKHKQQQKTPQQLQQQREKERQLKDRHQSFQEFQVATLDKISEALHKGTCMVRIVDIFRRYDHNHTG
jgi:hypothetical protein